MPLGYIPFQRQWVDSVGAHRHRRGSDRFTMTSTLKASHLRRRGPHGAFPAGWTRRPTQPEVPQRPRRFLVDPGFDQYDDLLGDGPIICGTSADDFDAMSVRTKDNRE